MIELSSNQVVIHNIVSDKLWRSGAISRRLDSEGLRAHFGAYRVSDVIYRKPGVIGGYIGILLTWRTESALLKAILEHDLEIETDITDIREF